MSAVGLIGLSLALPLIVIVVVTVVVAAVVRRSPTSKTWRATRDGVLFVMSLRKWQRVMIRTLGIIVIVLGGFTFLVAITTAPVPMDMGIAGIAMVVGGVLLILLAHGMSRLRLEVTPDMVWSFPLAGAPRQVAVGEIRKLAPLRSSNFGGVDVRSDRKRLFYATRVMLNYSELIDFLREKRPDLFISTPHERSDDEKTAETSATPESRQRGFIRALPLGTLIPAFFIAVGLLQQSHASTAWAVSWHFAVLVFVVTALTVMLPERWPLPAAVIAAIAFAIISARTALEPFTAITFALAGFFFGLFVRAVVFQLRRGPISQSVAVEQRTR